MIRSMTGYGAAELDTPRGRLRVEVRSVNHRHFSPRVRTPPGLERYEAQVEGRLRQHIARGHVQCHLRLDRAGAEEEAGPVEVDIPRARAYRDALEGLRRSLELPGEVDLTLMARFRELLREPEQGEGLEFQLEDVERVTDEACRELVAVRESEGRRLEADLRERLTAMEEAIDAVERRAPGRLVAERDRLRGRIQELLEGMDADEERIDREIAHLAERWDLNEEVVRFRSHLDLFRETLEREESEAVGKRLGFIVQEMHREVNTVGAKANDAGIAHQVVAMKEELERIREQVENVE